MSDMGITYHRHVDQGSMAWHALRCGILTASTMKLILTPKLKKAANDKQRAHFYEVLAQRVSGYAEDPYTSDDMFRGHEDEIDAKIKYAANYAPLEDCGFITNDSFGFTIGYSPDGLVGADGLFENKSRKHKFQVETILTDICQDRVPAEFQIQVQTGLLVAADRSWIDFATYSAGLPMATVRAVPDPVMQAAIIEAATEFEAQMAVKLVEFERIMNSDARLLATERRYDQEIRL